MRLTSIIAGTLCLMTGCVTMPLSPNIAVMPGPGKPFELFVAEEHLCRNYAAQQVGPAPAQAAAESVGTGAVAGTVLGAAAGAALGALGGRPALGAAAGAGTGLLLGTGVGADAGSTYSWHLQRRYDIAYSQCMYAKGNQVPGYPVVQTPPPPPPPPGSPPPAGFPR